MPVATVSNAATVTANFNVVFKCFTLRVYFIECKKNMFFFCFFQISLQSYKKTTEAQNITVIFRVFPILALLA
jgi:hypothetical protein